MLRREKITTTDVVGVKPRVLEILQENPTLPYSIVADEVGVTRERVRQIAKRNGYPRRNGVLNWKICPICGKAFSTANLYCSHSCVYKARQKRIVLKLSTLTSIL